ncbi:insulin-like growth factor I [Lineus longissimus]|uniref:insulin-like growth factor I n=1 Tax=Lineus longissimus TaxID=88925 RepID=UPI00315D6812
MEKETVPKKSCIIRYVLAHVRIFISGNAAVRSITNMNIQSLFLIVVFQISIVYGLERLCGRTLADVLDLICQGRGFHGDTGIDHEKRSFRNQMITRRQATTFLVGSTVPPSMAARDGVVEECCLRHCTYETLESYCAEPSSTDDEIDLEEFLNPSSSSTSSTTSTTRLRTTTAGPPTTRQFRHLPASLKGRTFFYIRNQEEQDKKKKRGSRNVHKPLKTAFKTKGKEDEVTKAN